MGVLVRDRVDPIPPRLGVRPVNITRSLTAAAIRVKVNDPVEAEKLKKRKAHLAWQEEAWAYYDLIGEIKYAFLLTGAVMSRMKLFLAYSTNPADPPADLSDIDSLPEDYLDLAKNHFDRLHSCHGGIPGMLRSFALNLGVAGECYLLQEAAKPSSGIPERWSIRSTDEIEVDRSGEYALRDNRGVTGQAGLAPIRKDQFIGRIWRPHPRFSDEPDSSMKALLPMCEELLLLNRTARASAKSRLNAGALFIPDGLSVAASPDVIDPGDDESDASESPNNPHVGGDYDADDDDVFERELVAAMTSPIGDDDSASVVVPMLIRGPGELGSQIKQFSFERAFDPALAQRADRVLERILQGIDVPKDVVTGLANVKYALSTDAEILTREGWKTYDQVQVGEDVYTLNHESGMGEWQPLLEINTHDHDGPMLRMESRTHSSLSTPEHRWALVKTGKKVSGSRRRWTTSADGFATHDRVETAAECVNLPKDPKWSDDFVRLVALYVSDGHMEHPERGRIRVNISTTARNGNPQAIAVSRAIIGSVDPDHQEYPHVSATPDGKGEEGVRFRLSPDASEALLSVVEGGEKIIRCDFIAQLTYAQLNLLLDSIVEVGDGNYVNGRTNIRRYRQTERRRLEPIAMAAVLAGWTVRWLPTPITPGEGAQVGSSEPCWGLTVTKARTWFQPHGIKKSGGATWEDYRGKVWCPTTANHTWLARYDGKLFFTGNSNAVQINNSLYRAHIEPLILVICDALTMIFLRPGLLAKGFPEDVVNRTFIWYDPTDILTSADRAANANEGWDRYLLSGEAWRSAHGFAETDSPSGDDLLKRMVVQRGQLTPELTESVLMQIAPETTDAVRKQNIGSGATAFPTGLQEILEGGTPTAAPAAPGMEVPAEILEGLPLPGGPAPVETPGPPPGAPAAEPPASPTPDFLPADFV